MIATAEIMNRCHLTFEIADRAHALIAKIPGSSPHALRRALLLASHSRDGTAIPAYSTSRYLPFPPQTRRGPPRTKRHILPFSESLETEKIFGKVLWREANERRVG